MEENFLSGQTDAHGAGIYNLRVINSGIIDAGWD